MNILLSQTKLDAIDRAIKKYGKLPTEFKDRWVKALRSGEYRQTTGTLYDPRMNCYCCLGVSCKVAGIDDIKDRGFINPDDFEGSTIHDAVPPLIHGTEGVPKVLSILNDDGVSFETIAEVIEKYL
jgi:hypothetical protein